MTTVTGSTSRTTIRQQAGTSLWSRIDRTDLARTLFVAACTAALAFGLDWPSPTVPLLAVIGLV
ncbi:cation-transporting P-type ATPase, partial [Propionibacterium freudenreichii]|nr:cation-transporting P-type ATPase [Propionibacterium freudenreichii]